MFEGIKSLFHALFRTTPGVPGISLSFTLLSLAFSKRFFRTHGPVSLGRFIISSPDHKMLSALLKEKFVNEEYKFTTRNGSPLIIDCGANIGISALYFKSLYPGATIHCFEPYNEAYRFLQENITRNKLDNVFAHRTALSNVSGPISLSISSSIINSSTVKKSGGDLSETVPAIRLSDFVHSLPRIDLVKIDVEGAEIDILSDLANTGNLVPEKIDNLIVEFHRTIHDESVFQQFVDTLRQKKYAVTTKILFPQQADSDVLIYAKGSSSL